MSLLNTFFTTFSASDLLKAVIIGAGSVALSWLDIKTDIRVLQASQQAQVQRDSQQDTTAAGIAAQIKDNQNELKQDIRDLRNEVMKLRR
jgi:hypothetical protein